MITNTGAWNLPIEEVKKKNRCDEGLVKSIVSYLKSREILVGYDFGCGEGEYVQKFREKDILLKGFDGNPNTLCLPYCEVQDLTKEIQLPSVDFLLCLEVGEHIPKEFEKILIENITKSLNTNGVLILSWAVPGQGGYGHVNEKTNISIIQLLGLYDMKYDQKLTEAFRNSIKDVSWLKNTVMVFHKKK